MSWYADQAFHVYLISAGDHQKLGATAAIETRVRHLQTANFAELTLVKSVEFPSRNAAVDVERYAQGLLSEHHVRGEWFRIDVHTAVSALDAAVKAVAAGQRSLFETRHTTGPKRSPVSVRVRRVGSRG